MDNSILETFTAALHNIGVVVSRQAINEVHNKLIWKIYNVRCNEFYEQLPNCHKYNKTRVLVLVLD